MNFCICGKSFIESMHTSKDHNVVYEQDKNQKELYSLRTFYCSISFAHQLPEQNLHSQKLMIFLPYVLACVLSNLTQILWPLVTLVKQYSMEVEFELIKEKCITQIVYVDKIRYANFDISPDIELSVISVFNAWRLFNDSFSTRC